MTKLEALAKDCIENHTHRLVDKPSKQDIYTREESIYISGYKECERQNKNKIAKLEQKLEQTEKDLTDYQFNYPKIKDLEKENDELKKHHKSVCENLTNTHRNIREQLTKAKEIIEDFLITETGGIGYSELYDKAEQFLNEDKAETSEEPYYVIMNMNCQYEICRKCPKSGLFKGTYEECENWIKEKLSEVKK